MQQPALSPIRHVCFISRTIHGRRGNPMQVTIDDLGATARVVLVGRLDIAGADKIDLPLATVSGAKSAVLIDMSGVTFIASIGLRHLVMAAKAMIRRGGSFRLLNPNPVVAEVITAAGLADILPIEQRA